MSDKDDISRLKHVKETEELQMAWDRWKETRQVKALFRQFAGPVLTIWFVVAFGRDTGAS